MNTTPLDLNRLKVRPLAERDSLTRVEDILLSPERRPRPVRKPVLDQIRPVRRTGSRGTAERGGGDPDLWRAPAAQRREPDSRADDGERLDHPPGHQRRGDDS